jgi:hypothetical protein
MGLGSIAPILVLILTIWLLMSDEVSVRFKVGAVLWLVFSSLIPRLFPSLWYLKLPAQVLLGIVVLVVMKYQGAVPSSST